MADFALSFPHKLGFSRFVLIPFASKAEHPLDRQGDPAVRGLSGAVSGPTSPSLAKSVASDPHVNEGSIQRHF